MLHTISRNFVIFIAILLICITGLFYVLYQGEKQLSKTDQKVEHSYDIISKAEHLSATVEAMLAEQRGFLLTGKDSFFEDYENKKSTVSETIAALYALNKESPDQISRLDEIRLYFNSLSQQLEERVQNTDPSEFGKSLQDVEQINNLRDNIARINTAVLNAEYKRLNTRMADLEGKKDQYYTTLLIGIVTSGILLLLFNLFLLRAQQKRTFAETSLKGAEERFALVIEGTQDGIYDWDIKTDKVFYSQQFFQMLGYDDKGGMYTLERYNELIHPDDYDELWEHTRLYLSGKLSEFIKTFRMKHQSGRWIWVQTRGKAVFDKKGKATRMVSALTDITATIKSQEKLEAEKEEAEAANQAKSEFLAHMSHEIRTPLTAISGVAEIMDKRGDNLDDRQKHLVKTLLSSTMSLRELINDILDFSKIESGELEIEKSSIALDQICEETIAMMSIRAREKNISFVFNYDDIKDIHFDGDAKRIRQILVNLVGNAIKFTDEGGVTIQAYQEERKDDTFLRVDVTDTGIGIAPEDFDLVFERFKQADASVSRKYGGTGLGLPISQKLAQLMGGSIVLSSQQGKGSTFSLLLPMDRNIPHAKIVHKHHGNLGTPGKISEEKRALIVEDYEGNIVVVSYILEELGIEYDIARTGAEGLDAWTNNHYDAILMDVQMPEMDGFTATTKIREAEALTKRPRTPIIGMTAHALVGDKNKCIEAGMDSYLPKPLDEQDLKSKLFEYLSIANDTAEDESKKKAAQ